MGVHKKTANVKRGHERKIDGVWLALLKVVALCQQIFQPYVNILIGILKMEKKCHAPILTYTVKSIFVSVHPLPHI